MKTPSTPQLFTIVLLVLTGLAFAGGAWQTIVQTLEAGPRMATATDAPARPRPLQTPIAQHPRPSDDEAAATQPPSAPTPALPPEPRGNLLFDRERLLAAKAALQALPGLEAGDLRVFHSIHFYDDGRINIQLVDPGQPTYVDEYHFKDDAWQKGEPVNPQRMSPLITVQANSAPLDRINFEAVQRVAVALQEQRDALMREPKQVDHVYLIVSKGGRLRWLPDDVAGDRETVSIGFDAQGNATGVQKR